MKKLTFKQLKSIVSEAKDTGIATSEVTMVDVDDAKQLENALDELKQAGAAAEAIGQVREALKDINFENVMERAAAKAQESAARTRAGKTKSLDDAAKAYAELDVKDNANYFFSVADKAEETGDRLGVFIRKTKNPMGGPAAAKYILKVLEDERFKKAHEDLCIFAESLMKQVDIILVQMAKAGVVLPPETKWTAELRKLQGGEDRIKKFTAKSEMLEGLAAWAQKAWDWAVTTYEDFKNWLFDRLENIHFTNKKIDRAAENFEAVIDSLNDAMDEATAEMNQQRRRAAMIQERRRRAIEK